MPSGNYFLNVSQYKHESVIKQGIQLIFQTWNMNQKFFEVELFQESVNFDFRNRHKGYTNKKHKSEHFIKINKNRAKTQKI